MFRWTVLAITLIVWLSCMTLVYLHYKPRDTANMATGTRAGLESIFADDADMRQVWKIYIDPRRFQKTNGELPVWNGLDETTFREIGDLETLLKKRGNDDTRRERTTTMFATIPPELNVMGGQAFSTVKYESRSDISMDHGLELFNAKATLGAGFEMILYGVRDGAFLKFVTQVLLGGKKQFELKRQLEIPERETPVDEFMPFNRNREVQVGYSWEFQMLDTASVDTTNLDRPPIINVKAKCTSKRQIKYNGEFVPAFEVTTEDGKARAWYSGDGVVLKQSFRLADTIELIVVRVDPKKFNDISVTRWREIKQ
jgi:hypothetical protein